MSGAAECIIQRIHESFQNQCEQSKELNARARVFLPGGDTRTSVYYLPYPAFMEKGKGCRVYDCDGNEYLDFQNNYASLIHGHRHPAVEEAITVQLMNGLVFGSPNTLQSDLAELLCQRLSSVELVRFTNSGSEATMFAIRAARAFTGKDIVIKIDGGYHGTHDFAEISQKASSDPLGAAEARFHEKGIPQSILTSALVVPYNDLETLKHLLAVRKDDIAAVIVEPVLNAGGLLPPEPGYLSGVRELTENHSILLIFDEVMTLRMGSGGVQGIEGVEPDLTALGKLIGGGFGVGAFGGRRDIMEIFDPSRRGNLTHAGTFNGHPLTMAAGIATLQNLPQHEIDRINRLGERLRAGIDDAFCKERIRGRATGYGSMTQIHWRDGEIRTAQDAAIGMKQAADLPVLMHLDLLTRGIFTAPRGAFCVSTAMSESEIDQAIAAFRETLSLLRPCVEEIAPHLLLAEQ